MMNRATWLLTLLVVASSVSLQAMENGKNTLDTESKIVSAVSANEVQELPPLVVSARQKWFLNGNSEQSLNLFNACIAGNLAEVTEILTTLKSLSSQAAYEFLHNHISLKLGSTTITFSPLTGACYAGRLEVVRCLLKNFPKQNQFRITQEDRLIDGHYASICEDGIWFSNQLVSQSPYLVKQITFEMNSRQKENLVLSDPSGIIECLACLAN